MESLHTYGDAVEDVRHFVADDLLGIDVNAPSTDGLVLVCPAGEIDSVTAPVLRLALVSALRPHCSRVVVDLAAATFLNSAGLTVLAEVYSLARAEGIDLAVRGGGRAVVRPLQITGLWDLLAEPME